MRLSIVIPVYNEHENLPLLLEALDRVFLNSADLELELVFVDDGSSDGTLGYLRELAARAPRVRVISLSRNFGSHAAIMAGLRHSSGDVVAVMAADLQTPPEVLRRLLERRPEGYQVIWGVRDQRDDPAPTRAFSWLYSSLMRWLALREMPSAGVDVMVADRQVVDVVLAMQEKNTSVVGLFMWAGFRQAFLPYNRRARRHGRSGWTPSKKLKLLVDSFVSFSFFPIRLVSYLGLTVSFLGFLWTAQVVLQKLLYGTPVPGWSSLMVAVVMLAGLQLLVLGIVAEYLWRTFDESRGRPIYIIKEVVESEASPPNDSGDATQGTQAR